MPRNPIKKKISDDRWRDKNREHLRKLSAKYHEENKDTNPRYREQIRAKNKAWKARNRERVLLAQRKYQFIKKD